MSTSDYLSRFTPSRTDPGLLEAIFVQRDAMARDAEERIADGVMSKNKYHLLFVGPRGSGKTHLVTVLVNRLLARDDLRDRLRIAWLAEDETTTSYLKFLLRIERALHQRYDDEFPAIEPREIPAQDDQGRITWVERQLVNQLAGRALLVVVENLDALLEGLGDLGQKQWRAFLQERAVANTLATSQQITPAISSRASAFHGTFRTVHLEPLNLDDAIALLTKIAEKVTLRPDLAALLRTPTGRNRVRAIDHLTGGSPRLYIMLSELLTRETLDDLVRPFDALIDELTPYYQERLRALPAQQREIVEYLARAETTVAVKTIADDLMHSHQTIAAQLKKLATHGYVRNDRRGRESLYELAEPLMRICVEVKEHGRGPIRLFVEFLRRWFNKDELEAKARMALTDTDRLYLRLALQQWEREAPTDFSAFSAEELEQKAEILDTFEVWMALGDARLDLKLWEPACLAYEHTLTLRNDDVRAGFRLSAALARLGRRDEALRRADKTIAIAPKDALAWCAHALILNALSRSAEAFESLDQAISLDPDVPSIWSIRAKIFQNLGRWEEARENQERAIAIDPNEEMTWYDRGETLYALHRWSEGDDALREAVGRFPPQEDNFVGELPSVIQLILASSRDRDVWLDRARNLIAIYDTGHGLTRLGEGLVASLRFVSEAKLNAEGLAAWREVWIEAGGGREALRLPLRMFEIGMRYHESGDPEELLTLRSEERSIVAEALGLPPDWSRKRGE